jgi:hypothetical protein
MARVKTICIEALERHCSMGETGRLDFQRGALEGHIFTEGPLIVHAQLTGLEGIPALFRLFDWGDADVTWNPGVQPDQASLHIDMEMAGVMYAEHLQQRNSLETREQERLKQAFATTSLMTAFGESVLKHYSVRLECIETSLLPEGFTFSDSTKNSYVIGSSEDCDVVLRHPSIDPLHCGLILENGAVYVWDLGSQAGIKLNSVPTAEGKLKVGDVMTLGTVDLRVRFLLKRPNVQRPATMPMPKITAPREGPPPKEIPKGAITYAKVSKQLKDSGKGVPFLNKLSTLFGGKDNK